MIKDNANRPREFSLLPDEAENAGEFEIAAHFHAESWAADTLLEPDIEVAGPDSAEETSAVEELDGGVESDSLPTAPNPIVRYLQDVRSVPLLSRDKEINLAQQIEEGGSEIVEEALSSPFALRCALDLGKTVAAGQLSMRDVVNLRIETSGEHLNDERILRARFRAGMRKLQNLAKTRQLGSTRSEKSATPARRNRLDEKAIRRQKKIAGLIKSLDLNHQQIDAIIQKHQDIYERAKELQKKFPTQPK